jgi:hypothetical protein
MNWQELRQRYPHRWVVVEAFDAYTEQGQRIIPHLELIADFADDWEPAWDRYKALHHADKYREYYFLHTDREELNIGVLDAFWRPVS